MKHVFLLCLCLSVFLNCKKQSKPQNEDVTKTETINQEDLTLIKGEFVYYGDAAILHTQSNIYGVYITDKMQELNKQAQQYKKAETDAVFVEVKVRISNKEHEKMFWKDKAEIVEILSVSPSKNKSNNIVELGGV